jgi:tight adherence protein C
MEAILYAAIMMVFISLGIAIYFRFARPVNPIDDRLREINPRIERLTAPPQVTRKLNDVVMERLAKPVYRFTRPSNRNVRRLRRRLIRAGFGSENAVLVYAVLRLASTILCPVVAIFLLLSVGYQVNFQFVALVALAGALGLFIPSFVLSRLISKRQERISRALTDTTDLLVVCVEAGLGLNSALQRVGREMELVEPMLSSELAITNREIRAGKPRDEALRNLGDRTGVDDIKSLVAMLIQSDRFGTSIANSLRVFADSMRT